MRIFPKNYMLSKFKVVFPTLKLTIFTVLELIRAIDWPPALIQYFDTIPRFNNIYYQHSVASLHMLNDIKYFKLCAHNISFYRMQIIVTMKSIDEFLFRFWQTIIKSRYSCGFHTIINPFNTMHLFQIYSHYVLIFSNIV
jgi:glutathionyl-hydroquinone reductase